MLDAMSSEHVAKMIPVTILTGFLGSGKTTLLNHLLGHPDLKDSMVLINEFGKVGIDHLLVERLGEDVVLLESGCLCCSLRGEMAMTMTDLYVRREEGALPPFDRILMETTGLADPAPILQNMMLDPMLSRMYRIDGVICVVDAVNGLETLNQHSVSVKQAAIADRLLISKQDIAEKSTVDLLLTRLTELNPAAQAMPVSQGAIDPKQILNCGLFDSSTRIPEVARWLNAEAYQAPETHDHEHDEDHEHEDHHHEHDHDHSSDVHHEDGVSSFVVTYDQPVDENKLMRAIAELIQDYSDKLLRIKGILNFKGTDTPLIIHGVQHLLHPLASLASWPDEDHRTRIVFITRDLDPNIVKHALENVQPK